MAWKDNGGLGLEEALRRIEGAAERGDTSLDLMHLGLSELPKRLFKLERLSTLKLAQNRLTQLPKEIGDLKNLQILDLQGNKLAHIPEEFAELKELLVLGLNSNQLTQLPKSILDITRLLDIYVGDNHLTELPGEIGKLKKLEILDLSHNGFTHLPREIGELKRLRTLYLNYNQLTRLPKEIADLDHIRSLHIVGNPLDPAILELEHDLPAIRAYLRSLGDAKAPLHEVKMVFVGVGQIGKTCLLDSFKREPFNPDSKTTEAFEIGREAVRLPSGKGEIIFNCWDFGGQKKYESTHPFFFGEDNLYLLLWNPRMGYVQCEVEKWLQTIRQRAGKDAKVIVIATHADDTEHSAQIPEDDLREIHPGIVDFHHISNHDRGEPLEKLKASIAKAAEDLVIDHFPTSYRDARAKVRELEDVCIPLEQFVATCAPKIEEQDARILARIMNRLGDVVYYEAEAEGVENFVILQPQWLGKAVGHVVDHPDIKNPDGIVRHSTLANVWTQFTREGYQPQHHPYFVWMMEKCSLSYRLEGTSGSLSLVPLLIRTQKPVADLLWEPGQPGAGSELILDWTFNEQPPEGLVPLLTARCHPLRSPIDEKSPDLNWQGGFFMTAKHEDTAFIELRDRRLRVATRGAYPLRLMSGIRKTVEGLIRPARDGKGGDGRNVVWTLDYDLRIPCPTPKCDRSFLYETVAERMGCEDSSLNCDRGHEHPAASLIRGYHIDFEALKREIKVVQKNQEVARYLHWAMFRALTDEANYGPASFAVVPLDRNWRDIGVARFNLQVFCDHPDCKKPSAEYEFKRGKEWLVKAKPAIKFMNWAMKVVLKTSVEMIDFLEKDDLDVLDTKGLELGKELLDLPEGVFELEEGVLPDGHGEHRRRGAALRVFHSVLEEHAPKKDGRFWGGLEKVTVWQTGQVFWLCPKHAAEYAHRPPESMA